VDAGVSPFEVRRRVDRVRVSLVVLDLTQQRSIAALGLLPEQLVADDLSICQELAEQAQSAGFEGILAPSAALSGEVTLAVFGAAISKITVELDRGVRRAPPRMIGLRSRIRWLEAGVAASVDRLWTAAMVERRRRRTNPVDRGVESITLPTRWRTRDGSWGSGGAWTGRWCPPR
jgi:hypothetical protein